VNLTRLSYIVKLYVKAKLGQKVSKILPQKASQVWWHTLVSPAIQEVQIGFHSEAGLNKMYETLPEK
jgi:hypothetical protein